jgi:hypothetical protein
MTAPSMVTKPDPFSIFQTKMIHRPFVCLFVHLMLLLLVMLLLAASSSYVGKLQTFLTIGKPL